MIYLDTSALAKAFVEEAGSEQVREAMRTEQTIAFSVIVVAEFASVLARRVRERALSRDQADLIFAAFRERVRTVLALPVGDADGPVLMDAARVCRDHTLTGADSIHLATAIVLAREQSDDPLTFLSSDHRLLAAAAQEGLSAVDPTPQ